MAATAIFEVQIAAERATSIVTSGAGVIADGKVFQSPRRADLSSLWQTCGVAVTV
jgi:predicted kinase